MCRTIAQKCLQKIDVGINVPNVLEGKKSLSGSLFNQQQTWPFQKQKKAAIHCPLSKMSFRTQNSITTSMVQWPKICNFLFATAWMEISIAAWSKWLLQNLTIKNIFVQFVWVFASKAKQNSLFLASTFQKWKYCMNMECSILNKIKSLPVCKIASQNVKIFELEIS